MPAAVNWVKKIKLYGGQYDQLNGLYQIQNRKAIKVPVINSGSFKKVKFELENCSEVLRTQDVEVDPYLRMEFTVRNPTSDVIALLSRVAENFVESSRLQLFEEDLEKTAALYNYLLKIGIGYEFCSKRPVLRDNYITFIRTGLGIINQKSSQMEQVKELLSKYLEVTSDGNFSLSVDVHGRAARDVKRQLQQSQELETTDIIDFLTHSYPSNFGWNKNRKFMMLNLVSYERNWNSVVNEEDEHWIEDFLEALSYIHDFWFDPAKKIEAVGAVLHVENRFVFVAVHLSGRRGKHVIVYDFLTDDGWSYSIKPFLEQQDGNKCGVFALIHSFQFMKSALFSWGVRKVETPKVKQMREILFQWKPEPRFQPAMIRSIRQRVLSDAATLQDVNEESDDVVVLDDVTTVNEESDDVVVLDDVTTVEESISEQNETTTEDSF
eukprot:augustus_masked-scaffold_26-processed-gene-3.9-mRNA-1 protein AED:1.00 eAED:1.00 QI:0/0/0/0/1/1/3/0/436